LSYIAALVLSPVAAPAAVELASKFKAVTRSQYVKDPEFLVDSKLYFHSHISPFLSVTDVSLHYISFLDR
jgi:hypothetical protein